MTVPKGFRWSAEALANRSYGIRMAWKEGRMSGRRGQKQSQTEITKRSESMKRAWAEGRHSGNKIANSGSFVSPTSNSWSIMWMSSQYNHQVALMKQLGLTDEAVGQAILNQGGLCLVCLKPLTTSFVIDHEHETNKFRALLHKTCNSFEPIAKKWISYLNRLNGIPE